jgi:two-component system response regulator DegU
VGTVKNHVEHIIAKLGASDRTQAVVLALELGIISFPEQ